MRISIVVTIADYTRKLMISNCKNYNREKQFLRIRFHFVGAKNQ